MSGLNLLTTQYLVTRRKRVGSLNTGGCYDNVHTVSFVNDPLTTISNEETFIQGLLVIRKLSFQNYARMIVS